QLRCCCAADAGVTGGGLADRRLTPAKDALQPPLAATREAIGDLWIADRLLGVRGIEPRIVAAAEAGHQPPRVCPVAPENGPPIHVGPIVCRPRCVASGLPPTARLIASSVLPLSSGVIESMRFMACLLSPRRNDSSAFLPGVYQTRTSTRRQIEGKASCDVTD